MFCIETHNLSYRFHKQETTLNQISLQVPSGSIYGFLGPNGAGKTTTLRLILGLLKKQEGDILIFGKPFAPNRMALLQKTGSLIEAPSLYAQLTATENLLVFQRIYGVPRARIKEVLEATGLADTGNKKAGKFSLGMKQRLSIALALLPDPTLLILDEPTNGLDPNGIIEIRELLKKLNREKGITLLVSSHLLSEIEKTVSHVGIINKGNLVFQGMLPELNERQSQSAYTCFDTSDPQKTAFLLQQKGFAVNFTDGKPTTVLLEKQMMSRLNEHLVQQQIAVYGISTVKKNLESIFLDLVNS